MKMAQAKVSIWSLVILIQCDKLSNHWPHADKVYIVIEVSLSIPFQAIYCTCTNGFYFLQQESHFKTCVLCTLHKPQLDHFLKNVILI